MLNEAGPTFDLAEGGLLLAFVRSLSVMALFSAYGALLFRAIVAPRAFDRMPRELVARTDGELRRLIWASLAVEASALIAWLVIEAGVLAEAPNLRASLAAVVPVLSKTTFGHVILMQFAATLATVAALGGGRAMLRWRLAAGIAALATLLHAGHSHALAMAHGLSILLASDGLHLLCAGAWLGGLVPLLLVVRAAPPRAGAIAARDFSPLGKLCLYGLVASAAYQAYALLGGIAGLLGTACGWMATLKAALFVVLFGFAWINRYRLAPALLGEDADVARRALVRSITLQTVFGLAVVIAAGLLSSLPPGLHAQPIWRGSAHTNTSGRP
jgi:putative copper export protein